MMDTQINVRKSGRSLALGIATTVIALGVLSGSALTEAGSAARDDWYRAKLKYGETNGYHWGVRATGPMHEPLRRICEVIGRVAPFDPDQGYVEADETTSCGSLLKPTDSVSISVMLGSSEPATTLLATLYRPIVREVVFILGTGKRRVYRTAAVNVANRVAKGIPVFRFLVVPFEGETCIRRIITHDGRGAILQNEIAEPGC